MMKHTSPDQPAASGDPPSIEQRTAANISAELARELIEGEIPSTAFAELSRTTLNHISDIGNRLFALGKLAEAQCLFQGLATAQQRPGAHADKKAA